MTPSTTPPALDFEQIRRRCPKAFAALIAWIRNGRTYVPGIDDEVWFTEDLYHQAHVNAIHPRDLFDFFDQSGVYIRVQFTWYSIFKQPTEWYGEIEMNGVNEIIPTSAYPTRTAAESAAFMAAFGKLEDRLKQEQG